MSLVEGVSRRFSLNSMAAYNPEMVLGLRGLKASVFFVNSAAASGGNGASWDSAFTTLLAAIGAASANDVILVAPGHAETIIAAAGIAVSKAGLQILGIGSGSQRPTFNYTTAVGASFDVTAAGVWVENILFTPTGIDNVTAAINVSASDLTLMNCEMRHATASGQAALGLLSTAAADRLRILGCKFTGTTDAGTNAAVRIVGGDGVEVCNNQFSGAYAAGTGPVENLTTAMTNAKICDNQINNLTAASTKAMVFVAASTGMISRNYMQILSGTAPITGAAMSWVGGNYYVGTIATAGVLI